ncbi:MAG: Tol biopolymer transport system component [Myxococcota bacterium]|jgi:Tol biopolymer transport system component
MSRSIFVSILLVGGVAAGFAALAFGASEQLYEPRQANGVWLDGGITGDQANAFESVVGGAPHAPRVVHPPADSVYPHSFGAPRLQWSDDAASRTYLVTLRAGNAVAFRGVTRRKELVPTADAWEQVRQAGQATIVVQGAVIGPDGTVSGPGATSIESTVTIAPAANSPTGMLLFGAKFRPPDRPVGTVHLLQMHLRVDALDLEQLQHRVVFRSSYGPERTRMHPKRLEEDRNQGPGERKSGPDPYGSSPQGPGPAGPNGVGGPQDQGPTPGNAQMGGSRPPPGPDRGSGGGGDNFHGPNGPEADDGLTTTQCVSCHAISHDGKYVATFSQAAEEAPPRFDAPNGFMTVLKMPERTVLAQLPHAFMPVFNPQNSDLLVYGEVDETIGIKDQQMVRKSDLRVLDLKTGKHRPIPGAALPDRVENFPFWSPDGQKLTFIRTKKGEMWHGAAGHINVAVIDFNNGAGGVARDLPGASNNNKSNFLPVYSRDGRWIVFTQADQGFFSQQSADLYIVPADGGEARKLGCNSRHTESWHRFSPSGDWLGIVTNREDIRRPHIYLARFDTAAGTCAPAVQLPVVAGPGAHTHAFTWSARFPWLDDYEIVKTLAR